MKHFLYCTWVKNVPHPEHPGHTQGKWALRGSVCMEPTSWHSLFWSGWCYEHLASSQQSNHDLASVMSRCSGKHGLNSYWGSPPLAFPLPSIAMIILLPIRLLEPEQEGGEGLGFCLTKKNLPLYIFSSIGFLRYLSKGYCPACSSRVLLLFCLWLEVATGRW